jgi:hypothetical protein
LTATAATKKKDTEQSPVWAIAHQHVSDPPLRQNLQQLNLAVDGGSLNVP